MKHSIDTAIQLQLPWPSDLQIVPAGPFLRFFALLIDQSIIILLLFGLFMAGVMASIPLMGNDLQGIVLFFFLVAVFVVYNGYFFVTEWLFRGQSPGKMLCGLRVLQLDGSEADLWSLLIRNLLRPGDMFPYLVGIWVFYIPTYLLGAISSAVIPHFRRLGDLAAGTVVVYERSPFLNLRRHHESPISETGERIYALRRVDPMLYEAIARFIARRDQISPARRSELAASCYADLKGIFAWTGPDPQPEELLERIHRFRLQGR